MVPTMQMLRSLLPSRRLTVHLLLLQKMLLLVRHLGCISLRVVARPVLRGVVMMLLVHHLRVYVGGVKIERVRLLLIVGRGAMLSSSLVNMHPVLLLHMGE